MQLLTVRDCDYNKHLSLLRSSYITLNTEQRFRVARERIKEGGSYPNLIVVYVSAIEGVLRSLVVQLEAQASGLDKQSCYEKNERESVKSLLKKYTKLKMRNNKTIKLVDKSTLELVDYAVLYRNLLVHDCTYLREGISIKLIEACQLFLEALANEEKITFFSADLVS